MGKLKIDILPNYYRKEDGTYDLENAIKLSGKIAGVCYDKEGFNHLDKEAEEKTIRRVDMTLNNGHHSVYDHLCISFNIQNIPKILAMVINNEKQYTTSEKSGRYTPVVRTEDSTISKEEEFLYNKWIEIFKEKIKEHYGYIFNDSKIQKLAQENARYMVTVFVPAQMIYTTTLRQINYLASWMINYYSNTKLKTDFEIKLANTMKEFVEELYKIGVIEKRLLQNKKHRSLSLFGKNLNQIEEYFGTVYSTNYKCTFTAFAQAHRHRTINYQIELLDKKEYFVPPILEDNKNLVKEWLKDLKSIESVTPQAELILVSELGTYENFILKCKERLCTAAQLEVMLQTRKTILKYQSELESKNHILAKDIKNYTKGARCTFKDFICTSDCEFKEGKLLTRKI